MKVFITKREPHPVKFSELGVGDCFQYESVEYNKSFIGMVEIAKGLCINLIDGTREYLYEDDLVHKVEVKIVNEI